jgi:hypothetical protein
MFRQYVESFVMIAITFGYTGFVSYLLLTEILKYIK